MKKIMLQLLVASLLVTPLLFSESTQEQQNKVIPLSAEHKKALEQRLADFTQHHLAHLKPDELQYLANLIYFTYALASLDTHVRAKAQEILFGAKKTQTALLTYTQTTEKEQLVKNLTTIDAAVNAQIEHLKAWQQCCLAQDALEPNHPLSKAIEEFKLIMQIEIEAWANEQSEAFNHQLEKCYKTLIETGESLVMVGNTYRGLHEGQSVLPSTPESKQVTKISVASRVNTKVDQQCWKAIEAALHITEAEAVLQEFSIAIIGMYYQAVSSQLAHHDPCYHTFMYNAQGLVPVEHRKTELP